LFLKTFLLQDDFWLYLLSNYGDKYSKTVFIPLYTAINNVMLCQSFISMEII